MVAETTRFACCPRMLSLAAGTGVTAASVFNVALSAQSSLDCERVERAAHDALVVACIMTRTPQRAMVELTQWVCSMLSVSSPAILPGGATLEHVWVDTSNNDPSGHQGKPSG